MWAWRPGRWTVDATVSVVATLVTAAGSAQRVAPWLPHAAMVPLALGLFTILYGALFAAVQTDMKRLLAYSSVENIGVIFTGIGLTLVFAGSGMKAIAALALVATLYHCLNHAMMKSVLFLGTGAVLHATGERNLGRLGGLMAAEVISHYGARPTADVTALAARALGGIAR